MKFDRYDAVAGCWKNEWGCRKPRVFAAHYMISGHGKVWVGEACTDMRKPITSTRRFCNTWEQAMRWVRYCYTGKTIREAQ